MENSTNSSKHQNPDKINNKSKDYRRKINGRMSRTLIESKVTTIMSTWPTFP